ncbi:PspC domain-containing protein [Streptomyces sp. T-3]|nr:PspC domain-containing protein [Streptomyces sp. T-3]
MTDQTPTAEAEAEAPPRRLRRDRRHKTLGGVCAGLGRHTDMDPVIFRVTLAVLAITGGLGLIFYGFAWLALPLDDEDESEARKLLTGRVSGAALTAILLALIGCGALLSMLNNGGVLTFAAVLALLLAGTGYWSQQRTAVDPDPVTAQTVEAAPPEAQPPPAATGPSWWRDRIVKDGTHVGGTGYLWGPPNAAGLSFEDARPTPRRATLEKPRGPRWLGGWIFLATLLAGGLGTGLTWGDHWGGTSLGTSLQVGLACALAVLGLGILISSFLGRTGSGSIVLAVITSALLVCAAALPANISTEWLRTEWKPKSVAQVQHQYELGSGIGTLDLSDVALDPTKPLVTRAEVGAGRIKVVVPENATLKLRAEVGIGDIRLPDGKRNDVDINLDQDRQVTFDPPAGTKSGGTIEMRLEVGVGQVEVTRAAS